MTGNRKFWSTKRKRSDLRTAALLPKLPVVAADRQNLDHPIVREPGARDPCSDPHVESAVWLRDLVAYGFVDMRCEHEFCTLGTQSSERDSRASNHKRSAAELWVH
jgi:hypothetical protein